MIKTGGRYCFTHTTGEGVHLFTLENKKGTTVTITNYGAIITSFSIQMPDGNVNDIVLGFDSVEDYLAKDYVEHYPWFGAAIGRYANRVKNAEIEIDHKKYQLSKNDGNNHLHGGEYGFDKKVWQFKGQGEKPQQWLELNYKSVDGEEGFPGNLDVLLRFELNDQDELSYVYKATADKATVVNLTHHDYFNLNNGTGKITDHEIKINSSGVLAQDDELVPEGNILPVENTAFDFREFVQIGNSLGKEGKYDKSFVRDKKEYGLVAEARSLQSGLCLQVYSTEPVVHFYTGQWIPHVKGKNAIAYGPHSGFCLETQIHPNAVNISHFPNTVLRPDETYYQKTMYKLFL